MWRATGRSRRTRRFPFRLGRSRLDRMTFEPLENGRKLNVNVVPRPGSLVYQIFPR